MKKKSKIFIAGATGLVGSSIIRCLEDRGYTEILAPPHSELDYTDENAVSDFFMANTPDYVFLAAARVGGIMANNTFPADFIFENLTIQNNLIHQSFLHKVKKLLFLGSSCIYPKHSEQPIKEEYLMTGPLEPTNSAYAVAKIAGIEMCWAYNRQHGTNFIPVMPTNLYGPNDNFDLETSHVLPALISKFYEAKQQNKKTVTIWGTGNPKREFLYVDDLAGACVFLMEKNLDDQVDLEKPLINIGTGRDISITDLANLVKDIVGYKGFITYDKSKPDGTPKKLLDVSRLNALGWVPDVSLREGIQKTYKWFQDNS